VSEEATVELLTVETSERGGWTVLRTEGQLDVATAPDFRQDLLEAQYGGSTRVVVDLDGVEFLDSLGLGVLVGALKRARSHDGEFVVACSRDRLLRLFEVTGLDRVLRIVAAVDEVLDA
jgi:anti-sigma B factor antagonist